MKWFVNNYHSKQNILPACCLVRAADYDGDSRLLRNVDIISPQCTMAQHFHHRYDNLKIRIVIPLLSLPPAISRLCIKQFHRSFYFWFWNITSYFEEMIHYRCLKTKFSENKSTTERGDVSDISGCLITKAWCVLRLWKGDYGGCKWIYVAGSRQGVPAAWGLGGRW
jgi:hypothetical protein